MKFYMLLIDYPNIKEISQIIMFCCTRKESHLGQIVTAVCMESGCSKTKNRLACALCLQQEHRGHSTTSMKKILPDLLELHAEKLASQSKLDRLMQFVMSEFGSTFLSGQQTTEDNLVERVQELLLSLKQQSQSTNQEINKMKGILKNLNKTSNSQIILKPSPTKRAQREPEEILVANNPSVLSPGKSKIGGYSKSKVFSPLANGSNGKGEIDTFSIASKHPYLSLSPDLRTASKVSHSGHRFAVLGAKIFGQGEEQVTLKIDNSVSGNIMVGVCHESIVREKDFANCYGINSGTYLIGQNGNNSTTAISFHHSLTMMNRKEVVGWNFGVGQEVCVGVNLSEEYVYFRKKQKGSNLQFVMKLRDESKSEQNIDLNLKVVVLLQSQGDQVSILEQN